MFLYLTEFFAGMSVMAVELGASRLLAPYFSSSQIVWTIIIGTIMIAMALGNIYGGRSADKNPDPGRLYARILTAAVWIAAIPVLGKYIVLGISAVLIFSVNSNFLIIAAFAACMVIFVFPLFLLGTVTPSLAKYSVGNLEESGKVVGTLGAFNTIGSIIGTFVPTFVTIPAVGTSITFLIFAGILLLLAVIYFISAGSGRVKSAVSVLCFLLCCGLGYSDDFAFWESSLTYEGESVYNYLQVREDSRSVILSTNVLFGVQSVYMKDQGLTGMYYDYAMAAPLMALPAGEHAVVETAAEAVNSAGAETAAEAGNSAGAETAAEAGNSAGAVTAAENGNSAGAETAGEPRRLSGPQDCRVLILGMGTGTYAAQCRKYFGDMEIEGVEIDDRITELARKYFHLPEDVPVTTYDGRAFLNVVDEKYDVIMVDAYQDITIPFQMSSVEFFTLVKEHLTKNGVMVVNMNMRGHSEGNINQYLADTIASVFDQVYTVEVGGSTNRELFASCGADLPGNLEANRQKIADGELYAMMERTASALVPYEPGGLILTDDKAPVELLGMRVIDEIIKDEVAYYKDIYERQGIRGLLEAF